MKIVLIGSGNVATNLAKALNENHQIVQIFSHRLENAVVLGEAIGCKSVISDLFQINPAADCYIISVNDDAIASVIDSVPDNNAVWVHTAGTMSIDLFEGKRANYGVLYPMQSFSKAIEVDFSEVPFFIEGNSKDSELKIREIAESLSRKVYELSSTERGKLHIAAVFACNFANHLWALAEEVLNENNLPFDVMLPLIRTTVDKLSYLSPRESQTGPAVREDYGVVNTHLALLDEAKATIYRMLSESIIATKHKKTDK